MVSVWGRIRLWRSASVWEGGGPHLLLDLVEADARRVEHRVKHDERGSLGARPVEDGRVVAFGRRHKNALRRALRQRGAS